MRKIIAVSMLSLLFLGCGLEGPVPSKKQEVADNASTTPPAPQTPAGTHAPATAPQKPTVAQARAGAQVPPESEVRAVKADSAPPKPPLDWSPDPDLIAKLSPEGNDPVKHEYRIQSPAGWRFEMMPTSSGPNNSFAFAGQWKDPSANGPVSCSLSLMITEYPKADDVAKLPFTKYFDRWTMSVAMKAKPEPAEKGRIGDIAFTRFRWTGNQRGQALRGVAYFAVDESRVLRIIAFAPAEGHDSSLRLAESAVLTLKKPSATDTPDLAKSSASEPPLGWSPDPALDKKLIPYAKNLVTDKYRIRPPVGWKFAKSTRPKAKIPEDRWRDQSDGLCFLWLSVEELPKGTGQESESFDDRFDRWMQGAAIEAKRESPEKGHVGGIDVARYRWTGSQRGQELRGATYFAFDDGRILRFVAYVPAKGHDESFRIAESAVLTLQKQ